ncbi:MAG: agmatinase [Actinomycetota bacterium]|nr:agmatinase [Actinomycetota bacterium]
MEEVQGKGKTAGDIVGPPDALQLPRFATSATFARLPALGEVGSAKVVVMGIPFDSGVSYRPGARFGPSAIRAGSKLLRPYNPALDLEPFGMVQVADAGDVGVNPFNIEEALASMEEAAAAHARSGARILTLGGDHTIALALLRAAAAQHGPIALVHFDAHLDTWDTYFGAPFTHGTPFRRAFEEGLLAQERCMHVGTRGPLYSSQDLVEDRGFGFKVISSDRFSELGAKVVASRIAERVGDAPLYVSIDIDVLDPAFAPATGTPEAGGLSSRELLQTLRGLLGMNLVGADIVEVAPAYDHAEVTCIAAAHLGYELISIMALAQAKRQ